MFQAKKSWGTGLLICALLTFVLSGCVRAKPEREREPLPTLPVTASLEAEAAEEALVQEDEGQADETEVEAVAQVAQEELDPASEEAESVMEEEPLAADDEVTEPQEEEQAATAKVAPTEVPTPELPPYDGPLYTVQPGDTLASIALLHASTLQAFMEVNGLSNSAAITPGQELRLPAGATRYDPEQLSTYLVRPGDTLSQIAAWHRMPLEQLRALNPQLGEGGILRAGASLTVLIQPIPEGAIVHVVQRGDSLASIAARYGVGVYDLAQANHINDANRLDVGQQLVIPQ